MSLSGLSRKFSAFVFSFLLVASSLSAGIWIYPVNYDYYCNQNGCAHFHYYGDQEEGIITFDTGAAKGSQSCFENGQLTETRKLAPDRKETINGKVYNVYVYPKALVYHSGKEQAIYVF